MEAQQNKKRNFLIGFGAAAVVLVAVLASWPPAFLNEDATGAIGAVQKHRAPQITAKDVVLVDEATRKEEAVLYGDYFNDAAKLESISTELNMALRNRADNLEARKVAVKDNLESVTRDLQGLQTELQARYESRMSDALAIASQLLARDSASLNARDLASVKQDIDSLSARIESHARLESAEMASLNARFESISQKLESRSQGVRMQNAERDLASVSSLASKAEFASADQLKAAAALQNVSNTVVLGPVCGACLRNHSDALESISLEQKSLAAVPTAIESFSRDQLGSKADAAALESAARDLADLGARLESRAVDNMQARLKAQDEMASRLKAMEASLGSAKQNLESRNASSLDSRFTSALNGAIRDLQARSIELQAKMAASAQSQLGIIASRLDNRIQLNARLESESQLGSRNADALQAKTADTELGVKMASRDNLGARLEARDQLGAKLQAHLSALTRSIDSRGTEASLQARQEQSLQARTLASRVTADLQARGQ